MQRRLPVLGIVTGVINEFAGILLPILDQLRPLFQSLANTLANVVVGQLRHFANLFMVFMPLLRMVVGTFAIFGTMLQTVNQLIVAGLTPAMTSLRLVLALLEPVIVLVQTALAEVAGIINLVATIFNILVRAISDSLVAMVQGFIGDFGDIRTMIKEFGNAIKSVVVQMVILAAAFARFLGFGPVVDRFKKGLDSATSRTRGATATNLEASIKNVGSVANDMAVNAANARAGAGGREDPAEQYLKQISDGIAGLDKQTLEDTIANAIKKATSPVGEKTREAGAAVFNPSRTSGDRWRAGRAAGGWFGGAVAVGEGQIADAVNWAVN